MIYQKGDWVIHDYEIYQVMEVIDGNAAELSNGYVRCYGKGLKVRPLTLRSKVFAETFKDYRSKLNATPGSHALNWPDIHRYFSNLCLEAIDSTAEYKEGETNKFVVEGSEFVNRTIDALRMIPDINGINLFRR